MATADLQHMTLDTDSFKESLLNNVDKLVFMDRLNNEVYCVEVNESQRGIIMIMSDKTEFELDIRRVK